MRRRRSKLSVNSKGDPPVQRRTGVYLQAEEKEEFEIEIEMMSQQNPRSALSLGGQSETSTDTLEQLRAKNTFLALDNDRKQQENDDISRRLQQQMAEVSRLQRENAGLPHLNQELERMRKEIEQLRSNQVGGGSGGGGLGESTEAMLVEEAQLEAPASAEDIERRANAMALVESPASASDHSVQPEHWAELRDKSENSGGTGNVYFHNTVTNETTWNLPGELAGGAAEAGPASGSADAKTAGPAGGAAEVGPASADATAAVGAPSGI